MVRLGGDRGKPVRAALGMCLALMMVLAASCSSTSSSSAAGSSEGILEVNVTNDPTREHGQPVVIANPRDPNNLVLLSIAHHPQEPQSPDRWRCLAAFSTDRGATWTQAAWPLGDQPMCGDPYLDVDREGRFFLAFNRLGCAAAPGTGTTSGCPGATSHVGVSRSLDGGRTWSPPVNTTATIGTTPRLRVDFATGHVYAVGGDGQISPHAVSVSSDHGLTFAPRAPLPPQAFGNQIAVYDGILVTATTQNVVERRIVPVSPVFWVSTDEGRSFIQRPVTNSQGTPVAPPSGPMRPDPAAAGTAGGNFMTDPIPWVSADTTRRGRFALMLPRDDTFEVYVTENSGESWTGPTVINAPGGDRPWIEFGPTGLLGVMWRTRAVDVYSVLSCDHGRTFTAPMRVNQATQPPGNAGPGGEWSRILPYARDVYVTWADGRTGGASEAIFARVPMAMYNCRR